jgi:DNA-binding transcriptional LysR family regulator
MNHLESMRLLVSAVDAGSLSAAAKRLHMPLPTVSRKVSELEAHLKTKLLVRSTRGLALTDAGRTFCDASRRILEDVAAAERAAAGEFSAPRGELILTAPVAFGRLHVLPVLLDFLRAYPEIDVQLLLSDRNANLLEDQIDLAVRIGELPDSSMVATRIGAIRRLVCASPAYLAARGTPRSPADLATHDCVTFDGLMSGTAWTFAGARGARTIGVRSRLVVNNAEAAIEAAAAGLGITRVLSYQAAAALRSGSLRAILQADAPPPAPVHLLHAGGRLLPAKLRAFLEFAAPRLKDRLRRE